MATPTLSFRVSGARTESGDAEAMLDGAVVKAIVKRLVVDLVAVDGEQSCSLKLPVSATEQTDAWREMFAVGAEVTMTLEAAAKMATVVGAPPVVETERADALRDISTALEKALAMPVVPAAQTEPA